LGSTITDNVGVDPIKIVPPSTRITGETRVADDKAKEAKILLAVSDILGRGEYVTTFASTVEFGGPTLPQGIYEAATTTTREYNSIAVALFLQ